MNSIFLFSTLSPKCQMIAFPKYALPLWSILTSIIDGNLFIARMDNVEWKLSTWLQCMSLFLIHFINHPLLQLIYILIFFILSSLLGSPVPWSIWSCPVPQLSKGYQWIEWRGPYYSINYVHSPTHCHIEEWANGWRSGPGLPHQEALSSISPAHH